jgi:hypothetical protein
VASVSERTGRVTATEDENADGVIDRRDDEIAADRLAPTPTTYRGGAAVLTAPATTTTPIAPDNSEVVTPLGPRPRASGFATLSLVIGVLAAVAVATGQLAGVGIGLGVLGALLAFGGIAATGRRHVAGKSDALLGMLLGLAAVVLGVLMMTNAVPWLSVNTNLLTNLHQWLQTHASWLLPS